MVADNNTTYHKSLKRKNIHHVRVGAIIISILQMRELKLRVKLKGHTVM